MLARPLNLDETLRLMGEPGARIMAGGTDIFPALGERMLDGRFVDINRVAALSGLRRTDAGIRIGANVTWTELIEADLPPAFGALKAAAREIGAVQIQNRGTLAGNLCNASPAADGVPPLLVLDAEVELASVAGTRRLPLSQFLTGSRSTARGANEVLTAIIMPEPAPTASSAFLKLGGRRYLVISIVMVAVFLDVDDEGSIREARIAVGSCSAVAQRLRVLEKALVGLRADEARTMEIGESDLAGLTPIDDLRGTGAYRTDAAATLMRRAIAACLARNPGGVC